MTWDARRLAGDQRRPRPVALGGVASTAAQRRARTAAVEDDFAGAALDPALAVALGSGVAAQRRSGRGGWLRLGTGTTAATVAAARPTLTASYVATTVVDVASITAGARAGLAAFGNRDNVLAVTIEDAQRRTRRIDRRCPDRHGLADAERASARTLATRGASDGARRCTCGSSATDRTRFQFAVSPDGRSWKPSAPSAGDYLPPWDLSVRVALLVTVPRQHPQASARSGSTCCERSFPPPSAALGQALPTGSRPKHDISWLPAAAHILQRMVRFPAECMWGIRFALPPAGLKMRSTAP